MSYLISMEEELKKIWSRLLVKSLRRKSRKKIYAACFKKPATGPGNCIWSYISVIIFCREFGIEYIHVPFPVLAHNYLQDQNYSSKWEKLSGLDIYSNESKSNQTEFQTRKFIDTAFECTPGPAVLNNIPNAFSILRLFPCYLDKYRLDFKRHYHKSTQPVSRYEDSDINHSKLQIAVHIRLGDVNQALPRHFTSSDLYQRLISELKNLLRGKEYEINVYSQGDHDLWPVLQAQGCILHIDSDQFESFKSMVASDIIFVAKSTFSISAAYFSNAKVFYVPGHWPVPDSWQSIVDNDGKFDSSILAEYFEEEHSASSNVDKVDGKPPLNLL